MDPDDEPQPTVANSGSHPAHIRPSAVHPDGPIDSASDRTPGDRGQNDQHRSGAAGSEISTGVANIRRGAVLGGRAGAAGAVTGGVAGAAKTVWQSRHRTKIIIVLVCVLSANLLVVGMLGLGVVAVGAGFGPDQSVRAMSRDQAAGSVTGSQAGDYAEASARSGIHWALLAALEQDASGSGHHDGAVGPYNIEVGDYSELAKTYNLDPITTATAERRDDGGTALGELFTAILNATTPSVTPDQLTAGAVSSDTDSGTVETIGSGPEDRHAQSEVRSAFVAVMRRLPIPDAGTRADSWYDTALQLALGQPANQCGASGRTPDSSSPAGSTRTADPAGSADSTDSTDVPAATAPDGSTIARLAAVDAAGTRISLDHQQLQYASTIIGVGHSLKLSNQIVEAALITALQESTLRMLANPAVPESLQYPHDGTGSNFDSVGLFQQRTPWGQVKDRMDATYESRMFFGGPTRPLKGGPPGVLDIPGHQSESAAALAQAVQVSAAPDAYAKWEPVAAAILGRVAGADITASGTVDCAGGDRTSSSGDIPDAGALAGKAIAAAKAELGTPYSFGGGTPAGPTVGQTAPAGWDCSSYVQMAYYRASGGKINLPRVTYDQLASPLVSAVPMSDLRPGDLIFVEDGVLAGFGHVVMYLGNSQIIEEPHTGAVARIMPLSEYQGMTTAARRVTGS